jgi:hypothetical protein
MFGIASKGEAKATCWAVVLYCIRSTGSGNEVGTRELTGRRRNQEYWGFLIGMPRDLDIRSLFCSLPSSVLFPLLFSLLSSLHLFLHLLTSSIFAFTCINLCSHPSPIIKRSRLIATPPTTVDMQKVLYRRAQPALPSGYFPVQPPPTLKIEKLPPEIWIMVARMVSLDHVIAALC